MKKTFVFHPFLFPIYFILFSYSYNIHHYSPEVTFLPIAISTFFASLCWLLLTYILKNGKKAGLLTSLLIFLFFLYGHFDAFVLRISFIKWHIGVSIFLFSIYGALFFLAVYFSVKTRKKLDHLTNIINIIAVSLVTFSLINIGIYQFRTKGWIKKNLGQAQTNPISLKDVGPKPDIYYIILDAYTRSDVLQDIFHYDNSELLDYLREKGFYIADKSNSNYDHTAISLCSSLNLNYLQEILDPADIKNDNRAPLRAMVQKNKVFQFLKQYGYKIVTFSSGYYATDIKDSDYFMNSTSFSMDEFQFEVFNRTPIPPLLRLFFDYPPLTKQKILYTLDHLQDTPEVDAPLFILAHIQAPHTPFYFGQGEKETDSIQQNLTNNDNPEDTGMRSISDYNEHVKGYRGQVRFVDMKVKTVIARILSKPGPPPIIIVQGDHGSEARRSLEITPYFVRERMAILNAYFFPDKDYTDLYESITPVNTFRIIFNHFFDAKYEILKNESYFSNDGGLRFVHVKPE